MQAVVERNGHTLNIGDADPADITPDVLQVEDGPQPKVIAGRIAAHLGHRIPGVRKLEKRLEGQDKSSGILSDMGALIGQLYYRNKAEIDEIIATALAGKLTSTKKRTTTPPEARIDFGEVGVPPGPSTNGGSSDA
jgi:stage V sporulation protein SpoVS